MLPVIEGLAAAGARRLDRHDQGRGRARRRVARRRDDRQRRLGRPVRPAMPRRSPSAGVTYIGGHLRGALDRRGVRRRGRGSLTSTRSWSSSPRGSSCCPSASPRARLGRPGIGFGKGADARTSSCAHAPRRRPRASRSAGPWSSGPAASGSCGSSCAGDADADGPRSTRRRSPPASRRSRAGAHRAPGPQRCLAPTRADRVHQ